MMRTASKRAAFVLSLAVLLVASSVCALACPEEATRPAEACHDAGGADPHRSAAEACCRVPSWIPPAASEDGGISPPPITTAPFDDRVTAPVSRPAPATGRRHRGPDPNHLRTRVLLI